MTTIPNATGAWGGSITIDSARDPAIYQCASAVAEKNVVSLDTAGKIAKTGTAGDPKLVLGVAMQAGATGDPVRVTTRGVVTGVAYTGTAPAAGDPLGRSGSTAGAVVANPTSGRIIGYAVAAGSGGTVTMYVTQPDSTGAGSWTFPVNAMTALANGDWITNFIPGFAGRIVALGWLQGTAVTTASKAATINAEIGTTDLTGGVVSLTSAACTPRGKFIAGTAVTGGNVFTETDTISIEISGVTSFAEGDGLIVVSYVGI